MQKSIVCLNFEFKKLNFYKKGIEKKISGTIKLTIEKNAHKNAENSA